MIRFGTLEFPAVPCAGWWVPRPFQPSQSFHFGSLEFVTDQLGTLNLREEEPAPAAKEDTSEPIPLPPRPIRLRRCRVLHPCTRKCRLRCIALMMASKPAAEDVDMVLYLLANVSQQLRGGPPLPPPQSPPAAFVFGQANPMNTYVQEARGTVRERRSATQLVGTI